MNIMKKTLNYNTAVTVLTPDQVQDLVDRPVKETLLHELDQAERKAWDSLARYKFQMFGYWAAIWVHLNHISGAKRPNPWKNLVHLARKEKLTLK